jgi:MFS family permease
MRSTASVAGTVRRTETGKIRSIRELHSNRTALAVMLLYVCHGWEVLGIRSWLAAFLTTVRTDAGLDLAAATRSGSAIAGLATVVAAVATAGVGAFSDRVSRLKLTAIAMVLGLGFVLLLGWSAHLPWGIVIAISLAAAFVTNADSAVISTQLTEVVPQDLLGRTLAIYSFLGFTAGSISPLVFGATLDYAGGPGASTVTDPWPWAFATFAAASVVGLGIVAYLRSRRDFTPETGEN